MGLFDVYDPNTYAPGADQGGLLDRILVSVAAAPTNVGPGFPASPWMHRQARQPTILCNYIMRII